MATLLLWRLRDQRRPATSYSLALLRIHNQATVLGTVMRRGKLRWDIQPEILKEQEWVQQHESS
jgi:hypothetical protein